MFPFFFTCLRCPGRILPWHCPPPPPIPPLLLLLFSGRGSPIESQVLVSKRLKGSLGIVIVKSKGYPQENPCSERYPLVNLPSHKWESIPQRVFVKIDECPQDTSHQISHSSSNRDLSVNVDSLISEEYSRGNFREGPEGNSMARMLGMDSTATNTGGEAKAEFRKAKKRPARIVIPESCFSSGFGEVVKDSAEKEVEVEGSRYCLVSRRGNRQVMEDGYGVITNIHGDPKQAYFGVFDGHGGRAAVDFVSEKLGKNIITALDEPGKEGGHPELAVKAGYLTTDREFLSQGLSSGTCAITVLLKDGELHVANVGDCRVVMSRNGVANALTSDHHPGREDERMRIEKLGGYVNCRNGLWRVQDTLAVSRAIGDGYMKEWIISEPETKNLRLTSDCEFLIMASDGLWDKVTNQEAVNVVMRHKNSIQSCKSLVDISLSRGNMDDITVMVVDLQRFVQFG